MKAKLFLLSLLSPVFGFGQAVDPEWNVQERSQYVTTVKNEKLGVSLCFFSPYWYPAQDVPGRDDLRALRKNGPVTEIWAAGKACYAVFRKDLDSLQFYYGYKWSSDGFRQSVRKTEKRKPLGQYPMQNVFASKRALYFETAVPWKEGYLSIVYRLDADICGFDPLDLNYRMHLARELNRLGYYVRESIWKTTPEVIVTVPESETGENE